MLYTASLYNLISFSYSQDLLDVAWQPREPGLLPEDVNVGHGALDHGSGVHLNDGGVGAHAHGELLLVAQTHGIVGRRRQLDQDLLKIMLRTGKEI